MVDPRSIRLVVAGWPEVTDESRGERLAFARHGKSFAWTFLQRITPRKPRIPRPEILAVRCAVARKEMLIAAAPNIYFDDDHYRGFPAVLVRLEAVGGDELCALLKSAACEALSASVAKI